MDHPDDIRDAVKKTYGDAAKRARLNVASCCGGTTAEKDPISRNLYDAGETGDLPREAINASLGCGNPTALADLHPGEVVLDLGSGGGIDVLLSARRVSPGGKAYGLDMTPEMLALARDNQREMGVENAEFLEGTLEHIPLPDASVDVVISNCVINLSPDKDATLREAFRVLKPGGRFAVSDIVLLRPLPEAAVRSVALWAGCVAGALHEHDYRARLSAAGFVDVEVEPTRVFHRADIEGILASGVGGLDLSLARTVSLDDVDGAVASAFVRARKPDRS